MPPPGLLERILGVSTLPAGYNRSSVLSLRGGGDGASTTTGDSPMGQGAFNFNVGDPSNPTAAVAQRRGK